MNSLTTVIYFHFLYCIDKRTRSQLEINTAVAVKDRTNKQLENKVKELERKVITLNSANDKLKQMYEQQVQNNHLMQDDAKADENKLRENLENLVTENAKLIHKVKSLNDEIEYLKDTHTNQVNNLKKMAYLNQFQSQMDEPFESMSVTLIPFLAVERKFRNSRYDSPERFNQDLELEPTDPKFKGLLLKVIKERYNAKIYYKTIINLLRNRNSVSQVMRSSKSSQEKLLKIISRQILHSASLKSDLPSRSSQMIALNLEGVDLSNQFGILVSSLKKNQ